MVTLLKEAGVMSFGKRDYMSGVFYCKATEKRGTELVCTLRGDYNESLDPIYKKFEKEEAKAISALLVEFGSYPYGKRSRQDAYIECKKPRHSKLSERTCELIEMVIVN